MARIFLHNVTKLFGTTAVVNDLTVEVRDGEFMVLLGPSGCGKTTVLRLIAGLEEPTSGTIHIGERLMKGVPPSERHLAMIFEAPTFGLYPHMSVYDNIAFGLRLRQYLPSSKQPAGAEREQAKPGAPPTRKEKESAIRERVDSVSGRLGIGGLMHRRQRQLSSGQQQEVALGRSMTRQPDAFLMDCPLSQLDPQTCDAARVQLRRIHRDLGATILYVTHDQQEAMALGDRIAVMNEGKLQQVGTARELYARPTNVFVAGFIGSPPMNLFPVAVESKGGHLYISGAGFRVEMPTYIAQRLSAFDGRTVTLGLRPEAIYDPQYPYHGTGEEGPESLPRQVPIDVRVTGREFAGRDIYLRLEAADRTELTARVDERSFIWPPDPARLALDLSQMHAFDPLNGRSLL